MAGRQGHLVDLPGVPCRDEYPAAVRMVLDEVYDRGQLIYAPSVRGRPAAPLVAVNRPEVTVGIGPFIPYGHIVVVEVFYVGVSGDEPQEFIYNGLQVHFLGRQEGESL